MKRSHARIVFECKTAIEKAQNEADSDKIIRVMSRYGRKTVDDAVLWINQATRSENGHDNGRIRKMAQGGQLNGQITNPNRA